VLEVSENERQAEPRTYGDPRLRPETLRERGVKVENLRLELRII